MNHVELGKFIDELYESLGGYKSQFVKDFENIIGGCHCIPQTEWYGDIYLTLKKMLSLKVITNMDTAEEAERIVAYFSHYFH